MQFVSYEALTSRPRKTIAAIYEFLGEERFEHDLEHLQQVVGVDDVALDLPNAHRIRPVLAAEAPAGRKMLGSAAAQYKGPYVWDSRR